jgi:hypothetical protein
MESIKLTLDSAGRLVVGIQDGALPSNVEPAVVVSRMSASMLG